jgi:competence ComEA-like helix-hairpin-helix protein
LLGGVDPRELKALITVTLLAVGGHLVRAVERAPAEAPGPVELLDPARDGDPLAQIALAESLARPLGEAERIDADRADARMLERLPGVGPALAARIVADRESHGAFGGIAGLGRVPGLGPKSLARLTPHLTFSGRPSEASGGDYPDRIPLNSADAADLERLPGIGPSRASAIVAFRDSAGPFRQTEDLLRVPGLRQGIVRGLVDRVRID